MSIGSPGSISRGTTGVTSLPARAGPSSSWTTPPRPARAATACTLGSISCASRSVQLPIASSGVDSPTVGSTSQPLSDSRYGTTRSAGSPYCARTWLAAAMTAVRVNADAVPANASAATAATTPTLSTVGIIYAAAAVSIRRWIPATGIPTQSGRLSSSYWSS